MYFFFFKFFFKLSNAFLGSVRENKALREKNSNQEKVTFVRISMV